MVKNCLKHIEVQILDDDYARVVIIRKNGSSKYTIHRHSYASWKLPRILEKAKYDHYSPPRRKGQRIKWTDTHYRKHIPAKHTYTF